MKTIINIKEDTSLLKIYGGGRNPGKSFRRIMLLKQWLADNIEYIPEVWDILNREKIKFLITYPSLQNKNLGTLEITFGENEKFSCQYIRK